MYSAISCTLWIRFEDEVPISVVKVEICSRIPSRSASARRQVGARLLQAQRGAADRRGRRGRDRVGDPAAVGRQARPRRPDPHAFPSTTKRALTARWRHCARNGSTAFAIRSRCEGDAEAAPSGRKRTSFASRCGVERADVLALEGERDRLGDELLRARPEPPRPPPSSAPARRGGAARSPSARRGATAVPAPPRKPAWSIRSPCARRLERRRIETTCARRGFGSSRSKPRERARSAPGRARARGRRAEPAGAGRRARARACRNES